MRVVPLPPNLELEKLLAGLLMREVKVKASESAPGDPFSVALYRSDAPELEVAVLCDLPLAASMAAALSVVPPGTVKDAVAAAGLGEPLRQNLAEVMNVLARFVSGSGRRFALVQVWCPPEAPDAKVVEAARGSDETRVVAVEVPGYLGGLLAFDTL